MEKGHSVIVIPAAGQGSRFAEAGYTGPKHLLPLGDKPMIDWVTENLRELDPTGEVIVADRDMVGETRGAVETIYRALEGRDDASLVIGNCDQLLRFPPDFKSKGTGTVFTFPSTSPAHSYVLTEEDDRIWRIHEKVVVSERAVSGVYVFGWAAPLMAACRYVLDNMGGELYLSSALRLLIDWGHDLYAVDAPTAILGTPEDFQRFEVALSCAA